MKKTSLFALALGIALYSCSGSKTEDHTMHEDHDMNQKTDLVKSQSTTAIIDSYLAIKNDLVKDDAAAVAAKSSDLVQAIKSYDPASLEATVKGEAENLQMEAAMVAENLATEDIAAQRESFQALSVLMTDFVKVAGTDRTLYQQHCPMYKDGSGGIWLSASEEIKNPLFGSSMLTCGKVEEILALN
ncbi:DUF3347 domain-containing protein [Algoriphagus vanfongensis]|uniref:DUF3347 domain-containing protein n=1 Tax=Algoriphagus vanfongensis TaxID=426371 RepID=UPI000686D8A8|nr:DUF3347 domain-containing protein [Algoriphagus vanfongensis]